MPSRTHLAKSSAIVAARGESSLAELNKNVQVNLSLSTRSGLPQDLLVSPHDGVPLRRGFAPAPHRSNLMESETCTSQLSCWRVEPTAKNSRVDPKATRVVGQRSRASGSEQEAVTIARPENAARESASANIAIEQPRQGIEGRPIKPTYPDSELLNQRKHPWMVYGICALCAAVYCLWGYALDANDIPWLEFLVGNFLCSPYNLADGRYWTLLTSCISHANFWHFMLNIITFTSLGGLALSNIGPRQFAKVMVLSGLSANLCTLGYHKYIAPLLGMPKKRPDGRDTYLSFSTHGLSGA